ncbi:iron hydrogenase [Lipomyces japonicus]|uniref:iron hydrogenase n=1 Tax=Lipomyces japonicus TaxID=56871 RepID=UPI0034CDA055
MSAILSANDLNDFISPGLACINPVVIERSSKDVPTQIQIDSSGNPVEVSIDDGKSATQLSPAQINLSDCLACSGCITSAESVLVSLQSHTELLSVLRQAKEINHPNDDDDNDDGGDQGKKIFVASISHQSRASLAAAYGLSIQTVDDKLTTLFKDILGFQYMVGTGVGRQVSLAYSALEVLQDKQESKPVLASACPGWICYVEKTHPHVLPYLSSVKSPQQITGSLLKKLITAETGVSGQQIYHVSVMPCFDKKLEASRDDFAQDGVRDVDCVITTKEIVQLLIDQKIDFMTINEAADAVSIRQSLAPKIWQHDWNWDSSEGSSSGGYLWHVLDSLAKFHSSNSGTAVSLKVIPGKNSDMVEYHLVTPDQVVVAKAAQVYGFRNIQNLVRKLKPSNSARKIAVSHARSKKSATATAIMNPAEYDYVEVMACPGGCINGGGQIGTPSADVSLKEWTLIVEAKYKSLQVSPVQNHEVQSWVDQVWGRSGVPVTSLVNTGYHAIESLESKTEIPAVLVGDKW